MLSKTLHIMQIGMEKEGCIFGMSRNDQMEYLPPKPEEPLESECCGSGCTLCVFDIYQRDLEKWEKECSVLSLTDGRTYCKEIRSSFISAKEFKEFKLLSILPHTSDTAIYRFKLPPEDLLSLESGQHLILRSSLDGNYITRSYTPIDSEMGYFDVMIKIYPNGKMSKSISQWSVGDMIEWRGPFGSLKYIPNQYKCIVMLAAGTGIAPMLQVIKVIIDNEDDETFIKLFYSCKTASDILMKQRIDEYKQFWNFQAIYFLTQSQKDSDASYLKYGDEVMYQRIDEEFLSMNLPQMMTKIQICGTRSFEKDMINYCTKIGYNAKDIYKF